MSKTLLDASALLALIHREPGHEAVADAIPNAAMSSVNVAEVTGKLGERGVPEHRAREIPLAFGMEIIPLDTETALQAGQLRPITKSVGLSLGDRCCLATAQTHRLPVLTADAAWAHVTAMLNLTIQHIRKGGA